jgi:hypothetical protein
MKAILIELLDRLAMIELARQQDPAWHGTTFADEFTTLKERLFLLDEYSVTIPETDEPEGFTVEISVHGAR